MTAQADPRISKCRACGGTGEAYSAAGYGDGWKGYNCRTCEGSGVVVNIDGDLRPFWGWRRYRAADGRLAILPELTP